MPFNEQNTVEHFLMHQLSGIDLNAVEGNIVKEDAVEYDTVKWKYIQADAFALLPRRCPTDFTPPKLSLIPRFFSQYYFPRVKVS